MLEDVLNINIIASPHSEPEELAHLVKQLECAELAQNSFIKGDLSLEDYCDILQLCGVNVDDYLVQVESNLLVVGMI